jgi:hypothetical protein
MRNGLGIRCSEGPTARNHTSPGQRPRLCDCKISEGLKARPIGPPWHAPTGNRCRNRPGRAAGHSSTTQGRPGLPRELPD